MTTSSRERREREADERTRRAWSAYRDSTRDLSGREYEETEHRSWERLQSRLDELAGEQDDGEDAEHGSRGGEHPESGRRPGRRTR